MMTTSNPRELTPTAKRFAIIALRARIALQREFIARAVARREAGKPAWLEHVPDLCIGVTYTATPRFYEVWDDLSASPYAIIVSTEARLAELESRNENDNENDSD